MNLGRIVYAAAINRRKVAEDNILGLAQQRSTFNQFNDVHCMVLHRVYGVSRRCAPVEHSKVTLPFANLLVQRGGRLERRMDVWLTKRRQYTYLPIPADTSETPVEALDVGMLRTLARGVV